MAFRGAINILLLFCLAVCAEASVRGMISGYFGRGRADVFYNGEWGSIGKSGWDDKDAAVFCRSLSFGSGKAIPSSELYNSRSILWLDNVDCKGNETSLDQCHHSGLVKTTVDPKKPASETVAGVQCYGDVVRISGGKTQGRAEIFSDGKWDFIAAEHWDDNNAKVFCSMLGFRTGKATRLPAVRVGDKDVHCTGDETTITHCPQQQSSKDATKSTNDVAGVQCTGEKVRIVGGEKRGRAEIFYDDQWGTICDSPGNNDAATVFCRMLGFWTGKYPSQAKNTANPNTPIWAQEFFCTGNESTLAQCGYRNLKTTTCMHEEDIEVSCSNVQARIANSENNVGWAELFFDGQYLPICSNTMTETVGEVFCRTLGLRFETVVHSNKTSANTLHLAHVNCNGDEDSIQQCTDITWTTQGCGIYSDALIKCTGDIAKAGLQKEVMLFHGRDLGSVCAHNWDETDASVYCRMMGYREGTTSKVTWLVDISDFHLTNLGCRGHEFNLYQCPYEFLTNEKCKQDEVAVANCTGNLVRIWNANEKNEGRAEIFYDGQWGSICSDYWDAKSAKVFCRMLGYSNGDVFDPYDENLPENTSPIWLSDVTCTGSEINILQCGHTDWEDHQCIHDYDAGVKCY